MQDSRKAVLHFRVPARGRECLHKALRAHAEAARLPGGLCVQICFHPSLTLTLRVALGLSLKLPLRKTFSFAVPPVKPAGSSLSL